MSTTLAQQTRLEPAHANAAVRAPAPLPLFQNDEIRVLSERLGRAYARQRVLREAGLATSAVDAEILTLRRGLREGGQLRAGDSLSNGRYLLIQQLGRGGFAVVWDAHDRNSEQRVAIKVLHQHFAGDLQRRERFFRGARAMMGLAHKGIVRVLDPRGEDEHFCYFVMELMQGGNLREAVRQKRIEPPRALPLLLQVGKALAEAHRQGMIHRDVKPANILLDECGNAKLADFDLVMAPDTTGGTGTGALGTIVYAAPECLDRPQEATTGADVFGLGMTAIFCLSGKDLSLSTFRHPENVIGQLDCASSVQRVLAHAVAWDPTQRFIDAQTMVAALRTAMSGTRWLTSLDRLATRRRTHYGLIAVIAVSVATITSWLMLTSSGGISEEQSATMSSVATQLGNDINRERTKVDTLATTLADQPIEHAVPPRADVVQVVERGQISSNGELQWHEVGNKPNASKWVKLMRRPSKPGKYVQLVRGDGIGSAKVMLITEVVAVTASEYLSVTRRLALEPTVEKLNKKGIASKIVVVDPCLSGNDQEERTGLLPLGARPREYAMPSETCTKLFALVGPPVSIPVLVLGVCAALFCSFLLIGISRMRF